jgi:hypothetical protein
MITEGDDLVLAKARGGKQGKGWPRYLPMPMEDGYKILEDAFTGKHPGIDPADIILSKQTTNPGGTSVKMDKAKRRKGGAVKKAKKVKKVSRRK